MPKKTFYIEKAELEDLFIYKNYSRKQVAEYYKCSDVLIKKKCQEYGLKKSKILESKNKERKVIINCEHCGHQYETVRFRIKNKKWKSKFCSSSCSSKHRYLGKDHKRAMLNSVAAKRRANFKNAFDSTANLKTISEFYILAKKLTEQTGIPHEVDHITPISKGGRHHENNLQILTQAENRKKHNKDV